MSLAFGHDEVGSLRSAPSREDGMSGGRLAASFGWAANDAQIRQVSRAGTRIDVARCSVSGEPAALFASVQSHERVTPLDVAALYAYHSTVNWGVLADDKGLTIFNSHWLVDRDWFRLPAIGWDDVGAHLDVLDALSPKGVFNRHIDRFTARRREPTTLLRPVDDELVDRLDKWREQAVKYAESPIGVDEHLQTLYAQMFVLRTVEDRGLEPEVPAVRSTVVGFEEFDRNRWASLMALAQVHIGSDLFDEDVTGFIPNHVISGVITDLYYPKNLPTEAQYDFSWLEADVLGSAYEKYLATVLRPSASIPQMELFQSVAREVERLSVRKITGAYYTPRYISGYIASKCVDEFFADDVDNSIPHVIDFSCGSGSFLVAAVDQILRHLRERDPEYPWARELIEGGFITGVDIDTKAVTTARLHLWQRLVQERGALPLPRLARVIICGDGLRRDTWGTLDRPYDIVLGNPPYLATSLIKDRVSLESRFRTARGRYDFSYLFVEQGIQLLTQKGLLGMVVPNRILKNKNGEVIRDIMANETSILSIVDFGGTKPFDADAFVSCIVLKNKKSSEEIEGRSIRVIEMRSLRSEYLAATLLWADQEGVSLSNTILRAYNSRHPSSGESWSLLSEDEERISVLMEDVALRLDTIAAVAQGIKTGANDLFIVEVESSDGVSLSKVANGFGESFLIETEILEPVVYGSDVRRYDYVVPERRLIYPYRGDVQLSDDEIKERYPHTWSYFQRNKRVLAARGSLSKTGRDWYALIRSRSETWLRRPKLIIRDLAPKTAFAVDQWGSSFLVGGTAVVPQNPELILPLLAYLNSSFVSAILKRSTPQFKDEFYKFEPQHIQKLPVLRPIVENEDFAAALGSLAMDVIVHQANSRFEEVSRIEEAIDRLIQEVVGIFGIRVGA